MFSGDSSHEETNTHYWDSKPDNFFLNIFPKVNPIEIGSLINDKSSFIHHLHLPSVEPPYLHSLVATIVSNCRCQCRVQVEFRDVDNGNKVSLRFGPEEPVERVFVEEKSFTYLYIEKNTAFLIKPEAFDQLEVLLDLLARGLKSSRNMLVDEQVAMFLHIISHHLKNRVIKYHFNKFEETNSRSFHNVLNAVICLQNVLFKKAEPITANSTDPIRNCLSALDETHIKIRVPTVDNLRYRTRKCDIATNMLGICTPDMQFVYVLPGWEGSIANGRVLRDVISRRHGLKVPHGCYYLVDAGYTNCEGFLARFRGQRYHLNEWCQGYQPSTPEEFFNMKHASARNVIERCFGLLKLRWGILRSPSFYPVRVHNRIIIACCLLHNFIRTYMSLDPIEAEFGEGLPSNVIDDDEPNIVNIHPSDAWDTWRMELANQMFDEWKISRN
ncbi:hypothetical protein J1N35_042937 [Gossypium stocksii]|uniref:DDE Tnp4 domain-containing protein n=1 Tax=Gossypium stocksii TaxID=47602 RepID=A0A9D3U6G3_9ROSI|nr:hypothetical protein J1N35_042937 [Gossypium stocksii]